MARSGSQGECQPGPFLTVRTPDAGEPTAGLDDSIRGEVPKLLSKLQAEMQLGIVIITHNLHVVRHIADRMDVRYLGRIVEQGDAAGILHQPRHPYTAVLLAANPGPDPDARRQRIEVLGEVPSLLKRPEGCEFHMRCPRARSRCKTQFPFPAESNGGRVFCCHYPM